MHIHGQTHDKVNVHKYSYTHAHEYSHTHMCTYTHTCRKMYLYSYRHILKHIYKYTYTKPQNMPICIYALTWMHIFRCTCSHLKTFHNHVLANTWTHTCIHTKCHTHMHRYTYHEGKTYLGPQFKDTVHYGREKSRWSRCICSQQAEKNECWCSLSQNQKHGDPQNMVTHTLGQFSWLY